MTTLDAAKKTVAKKQQPGGIADAVDHGLGGAKPEAQEQPQPQGAAVSLNGVMVAMGDHLARVICAATQDSEQRRQAVDALIGSFGRTIAALHKKDT